VHELEAGADHLCGAAIHRLFHQDFSRTGARFLPAYPGRDCAHQLYLQEHISGMVVLQLFNRERKAYNRFFGN